MNDYNFWADLLDAFRSSPDWIKALGLVVPPGFILALTAMLLRFRMASKQADIARISEPVFSVHRDTDGQLMIVRHDGAGHDRQLLSPLALPLQKADAQDASLE